MEKITVEQINKAVEEYGIERWKIRECSICDYTLSYLFADGKVNFDPGCYCTNLTGPFHKRSYEDVANLFNLQTPEIRERMWGEFIGLGSKSKC